jgi:hypothetical protein
MRRRMLALFAGVLVLGLNPGPALAYGVWDVYNDYRDLAFCGPGTFAQTVTVVHTGKLTGVDLYLKETSGANTTVWIESLYRGTGFPFEVLASATVQVLDENWYHFEFPAPVSFLAGGKFAIVFSVTSQGCAYGSDTNPYDDGAALSYGSLWTSLNANANLDFAIRTFVTKAANPTAQPVPTPTPAPTPAPTAAPTAAPTSTPTAAPTPTQTPIPTATATTDLASPTASASASPSARPDPQSGDSGGPPILIVIFGIVALAAVLGGGIGLGFVLARRSRLIP